MTDNGGIKEMGVQMIADYIGTETAKLYKDFYDKQNDETVFKSLKALLSEYLGEARTTDIFTKKGLQEPKL